MPADVRSHVSYWVYRGLVQRQQGDVPNVPDLCAKGNAGGFLWKGSELRGKARHEPIFLRVNITKRYLFNNLINLFPE